jgi:hypothetical protein
MKKLISIKSDESGENIYFTHKNGVDAFRKDDVVDIELLNPIRIKKKLTDLYQAFQSILILHLAIAFSVLAIFYDVDLIGLIPSFIISFFLCKPFFERRNSRDILKIYSKKGIMKYKIKNDRIFKELYLHFKKEIKKYFPKKDELILFTKNPIVKYDAKNWYKIFLVLFVLSIVLMILKGIMPYNDFFRGLEWPVIIGISIGSYFSTALCRNNKDEYKNSILVILKESSIELGSRKFNLSDVLFREEKGKVSICFWDQPNDDYENLIFDEEYRDIAPLIMEYLNDLSEEKV